MLNNSNGSFFDFTDRDLFINPDSGFLTTEEGGYQQQSGISEGREFASCPDGYDDLVSFEDSVFSLTDQMDQGSGFSGLGPNSYSLNGRVSNTDPHSSTAFQDIVDYDQGRKEVHDITSFISGFIGDAEPFIGDDEMDVTPVGSSSSQPPNMFTTENFGSNPFYFGQQHLFPSARPISSTSFVRPFRNVGNTCFMNVAVRIVLKTLADELGNLRLNGDTQHDSLLKALQNVYNCYEGQVESQTEQEAAVMRNLLMSLPQSFQTGGQHCMAECLDKMVNTLFTEKGVEKILSPIRVKQEKLKSDEDDSIQYFQQGCIITGEASSNYSSYLDALKQTVFAGVQDVEGIKYQLSAQPLEKGNEPPHLHVNLVIAHRLNIKVNEPFPPMTLEGITIGETRVTDVAYDLSCFAVHMGSHGFGHWVTVSREEDEWVLYNDKQSIFGSGRRVLNPSLSEDRSYFQNPAYLVYKKR